jgi:hypothetical protein
VEPEVAGLIDFSSLDPGGIEPVDLDIQNAYSSWLSEGNTGSLSDFTAATSETTPTDLTDMGAGSDTDAATIAPPGLLASVLDPKPMIGLAAPKVDAPAAPTFNISERGRDLAIRTMIGEAASEPDEGMAGVGAVTINRLKSGRWGDDLEKVVLAPNQFEPWSTRKDELLAIKPDDPQYQRAASIFDKVAKGEMPDPTKGALNFANPEIVAARGNTSALGWIDKMKANGTGVQIGRHLFGNPDVAAGGEAAAPRPPGLVPFFKPQTIPVREGVDFAGIKPSVRGLYDRLSKAGIDGLEVVSGYRDPQRNARVGGASGSRHIEGDALDFNIEKLSDAQRQKLIDEAVAGGARGIGIYPGGRSVHIDMRETPTAWGANPDAPYSGVADPKAYPAWAQPGLQRLFGGEGGPRVQAAAFAPEERSRPSAPSYDDRMASIGAQRIPADGFDGSRLPNVQNLDTTQAERPGLLGDLLSPERAIPGQAPLSSFKTIPGAIDPAFTYQDGPRGLPRAPEPTARDMVAGARTGNARSASIARDNRADSPAVRSATVSTTGGRAVNPVMQEDLSNAPDGGARQFAAMEASRGGPFSMFGGGQEAPQAAAGGAAPVPAGEMPATGSAPMQSASGAAAAVPASGGGWKMSPVMSDFFLALGSSLLSSPKGQPLAGFGKTFAALQIASQETNKTAQQQSALASELVKAGIPASEAVGLAANPAAAKMAVERVQLGLEKAKESAANKALTGAAFGDLPTSPVAAPSSPAPAATEGATSAPAQSSPQTAAPSAATPAPPAPTSAGPANADQRLNELTARRKAVIQKALEFPSEKNRQNAQLILGQIDKEMEQISGAEGRQLDLLKKRRELEGEGAAPLSQEERASLGIGPGQAAYRTRSGEIKFGPAGTKIEMPGQEREFDKEAGKAVAKRFEAMATEGDAARQDRALIGQLRSLGGKIGNMGAGAALQGRLAEWGVKVGDNVSEIEAYNAIVDKLTPQQRVPGTGASSDKDIGLFKSSLPSLVRTPEGNALVIDTLDAVAADKEARAAIAEKALFKEMTPAQAVESLRALPDPLARFKEMQAKGAKNGGGGAGSTVRPDGSSPPTPSAAPAIPRDAAGEELRRRGLIK